MEQHATVVLDYYPGVKHSFPAHWWDFICSRSEEMRMIRLLKVLKLQESRNPPWHPPPPWPRTIFILQSDIIPHTRLQLPNKFLNFLVLGVTFQMHHKHCRNSGTLEPEVPSLPWWTEVGVCCVDPVVQMSKWWYLFYALWANVRFQVLM